MKAKGEAIAERFIWTTQTGQELAPADMRTSHLFYSLRMIFNHTAPAHLQIPGCKHYAEVDRWPRAYRRQAVAAFVAELARRKDTLPAWMLAEILHMSKACKELHLTP